MGKGRVCGGEERRCEMRVEGVGRRETTTVVEGYLFAFGKQRVWAVLCVRICVCVCVCVCACPSFRVTKDEGRPIKSLFPPSSLYRV